MQLKRLRHLTRRRFLRRFLPRPKQRYITLHIGAHKTGTTYIQRTLDANRASLPLHFEVVPRRDPALEDITRLLRGISSVKEASLAGPELTRLGKRLAHKYRNVANLILSHEDIMGIIPTRQNIKGLYPYTATALPALVNGLSQGGVIVKIVIYTREISDWKASLFRYKHRENPNIKYHPKVFAARFELPDSWENLIQDLKNALPEPVFHHCSYEEDRDGGLLGRAFYQIAGLPEAVIANLVRIPAANVSRKETLHDNHTAK